MICASLCYQSPVAHGMFSGGADCRKEESVTTTSRTGVSELRRTVSAPALHGAQLAPIPGRWSADAPFQAHDNLSLQVVYRITPSMSMFQRKKLLIPAQIPV